jgi:hypothetical protein
MISAADARKYGVCYSKYCDGFCSAGIWCQYSHDNEDLVDYARLQDCKYLNINVVHRSYYATWVKKQLGISDDNYNGYDSDGSADETIYEEAYDTLTEPAPINQCSPSDAVKYKDAYNNVEADPLIAEIAPTCEQAQSDSFLFENIYDAVEVDILVENPMATQLNSTSDVRIADASSLAVTSDLASDEVVPDSTILLSDCNVIITDATIGNSAAQIISEPHDTPILPTISPFSRYDVSNIENSGDKSTAFYEAAAITYFASRFTSTSGSGRIVVIGAEWFAYQFATDCFIYFVKAAVLQQLICQTFLCGRLPSRLLYYALPVGSVFSRIDQLLSSREWIVCRPCGYFPTLFPAIYLLLQFHLLQFYVEFTMMP